MKTLSDSEIIDALGGTAAVARLCRVKQPSVSGWRVMGIPDARRQFLELLRPDIFGISPLPRPSFRLAEIWPDMNTYANKEPTSSPAPLEAIA